MRRVLRGGERAAQEESPTISGNSPPSTVFGVSSTGTAGSSTDPGRACGDQTSPRASTAAATLSLAGAGAAHAALPAPFVGPFDLSAPANGSGIGTTCGSSACPGIGGGDVALTPAGDLVAAWTRKDATGVYHVETAVRPAGGAFGAAREIGIAAQELDPFISFRNRP